MPSAIFVARYEIATASLQPDHPFVATSRKNLEDFCAARGRPLPLGAAAQPTGTNSGPTPHRTPPPPHAPSPTGRRQRNASRHRSRRASSERQLSKAARRRSLRRQQRPPRSKTPDPAPSRRRRQAALESLALLARMTLAGRRAGLRGGDCAFAPCVVADGVAGTATRAPAADRRPATERAG